MVTARTRDLTLHTGSQAFFEGLASHWLPVSRPARFAGGRVGGRCVAAPLVANGIHVDKAAGSLSPPHYDK